MAKKASQRDSIIYLMFVNSFVNIYDYSRFRRYLAEYQERRCLADSSFTRTEFCRQLGLPRTRSYVNDVIQGKHITKVMLGRFLKVLGLDDARSRYFKAMVQFDQAASAVLREQAFAEMQKLHPNPQSLEAGDAFAYYSRWYHSALFAILDVVDADANLEEIRQKITPSVSIENLRESISLLSRLDLIRKNEQGFWKPTRERVSTGSFSKEECVRQYQVQCTDLSRQSLEGSNKNSKDMTSMTFSISHDGVEAVLREMDAFRIRLRKIIAEDSQSPNQVLHMNLHLISILQKDLT